LKFIGPFTGLWKDNNQKESPLYSVYPNPVNDELNIAYITLDNETDFIMTDLTGKTIKSFRVHNLINQNTIKLNTFDIGKGVYFLRASNIGSIKIFKD
jgi:hypothetical protein